MLIEARKCLTLLHCVLHSHASVLNWWQSVCALNFDRNSTLQVQWNANGGVPAICLLSGFVHGMKIVSDNRLHAADLKRRGAHCHICKFGDRATFENMRRPP